MIRSASDLFFGMGVLFSRLSGLGSAGSENAGQVGFVATRLDCGGGAIKDGPVFIYRSQNHGGALGLTDNFGAVRLNPVRGEPRHGPPSACRIA